MPLVNLDVQLHSQTGDCTVTKIKIVGSRSNRELSRQYERVGVYRLSHLDMTMLVRTMTAFFGAMPDYYPGLKAGNWNFEYDHPIEFQAISYVDIAGWKMLMMVEDESLQGVTVSLCFSGMTKTPMLVVKDFDQRFLQGAQLLTRLDDIMPPPEPEIRKPSLWQRFKNFFRWKRPPKSSSSSSTSVLSDIGDAIGDIISD